MTRRFVLYRSPQEHSADCERYPFERIPRCVFLDTNIISCLVKHAACIFEMNQAPLGLDTTLHDDIESLMHVFQVGTRANWDIVASEKTIEELSQTRSQVLREELLEYGIGLVACDSVDDANEEKNYPNDLARRLRDSQFLASLPDVNDRDLIAHAIALRCDVFCTRDRRSIHRKRDTLRSLPIMILTPNEWWHHVKPWAGLWC